MAETILNELRLLRGQCATTLQRLDALLEQFPANESVLTSQARISLAAGERCSFVTQHALDRYRERTGSKASEPKLLNTIAARISDGEEWEIKPQFRVHELLNHDAPATYFRHGDMLFVIESGVLVTTHHATADRWRKRPA